jgi:hypothetical protein
MRYSIMGRKTGEAELLDETEIFTEAQTMLDEYRMAFDRNWTIYVEVEKTV